MYEAHFIKYYKIRTGWKETKRYNGKEEATRERREGREGAKEEREGRGREGRKRRKTGR